MNLGDMLPAGGGCELAVLLSHTASHITVIADSLMAGRNTSWLLGLFNMLQMS